MKQNTAILLLSLLAAGPVQVVGASAPQSTDMPVALPTDRLCTLSAGSRVIDYGSQSRWQLQPAGKSQTLTLGKRTLMFSVVCPYNQTMRFELRGDLALNGELLYGSRGSLGFKIMEAQVDGQGVQLTLITPGGNLQGPAEASLQLLAGQNFAPIRNGQLIQGKSFNARVEIEPTLPEASARVSGREISQTNLTIELID